MSTSTIIQAFGGYRHAARALVLPDGTVRSWLISGLIPAHRQADVLATARLLRLGIEPADFFAGEPRMQDIQHRLGQIATELRAFAAATEASQLKFAASLDAVAGHFGPPDLTGTQQPPPVKHPAKNSRDAHPRKDNHGTAPRNRRRQQPDAEPLSGVVPRTQNGAAGN